MPVANTCNELSEMDFADYWDFPHFCTFGADFQSARGSFLRMRIMQGKQWGRRDGKRFRVVLACGAPGVISVGEDPMVLGRGVFRDF